MPELPEVETVVRGLDQHLPNQVIKNTIIRQAQLRWKIPVDFPALVKNSTVVSVQRRAKYILIQLKKSRQTSWIIAHLGMSGQLLILDKNSERAKDTQAHDHVDFDFGSKILRYNDPRRFGCILYTNCANPITEHYLLNKLGPEPLTRECSAEYLFKSAQNKKQPIKIFIMDQKYVVGIGNIYATEALFMANIHPEQPCKTLTLEQWKILLQHCKAILRRAIKTGGTTLRDFVHSDGKPGYFKQQLRIYGKENQPCHICNTTIQRIVLGQRSSTFCPKCQVVNSKLK